MPGEDHIGRRLMVSATIAAAMLFVAFGLAVYSLYSSHQSSCDARNTTLNVLVDILAVTRPTDDELRTMPADRRDRAEKFYDFAFARIAKARC